MIFIYLVALLAGTLWGITESINKNITEKKYSAFSYFLLQIGLNLILYTGPFILYGSFVKEPIAYFYLFTPTLFIFLGNLFLIKAYKTEDISNINILSRSSLIIVFLSGILFLHEKITYLNTIGILSIISGILVIFYEGKKLNPSTGFYLALASGILMGALAYFRKLALFYFNPITVVFLSQLSLVIILLLIPQSYQDLKPIFTKYKKKIILSRFTAVTGFYLINWAFAKGNISIANTNYETAFLLSTSFMGITFMGERKHIAKKLIGSLLCIFGIILLNFL
ncbi:hypothetical protein A3D78_04575 [Candidatus Gottesmanbacteria bacterium RIFCSPHIGHO2_02_FULL_39_14]|uniref:EamA domain-containing protein n=1 Tax=Candidatus Gottesmanbacteria bacterium RIFCSPHIGHO2_02_FULL_39_14 TaxID=1798383 RepID=A0A1F6A3T5_9BACT|nr:MAG: hypothetical protein A3D78_04575 [Candidatus Gottesmanbacteria bacterium RIFCSPHIGHO2_02_FULL_39_14]